MAENKKTISSFYVEPPQNITGRTITITPSTQAVFNQVKNEDVTVQNSVVSGDDNEFYSGNYPLRKQTPIFSVSYTASSGYHFPDPPKIIISNEKSASGFFDVKTEVNPVNLASCIYKSFPINHMTFI